MNPLLASLGVCIATLGMFWLAREKNTRSSTALWIPTIWLVIGSTRPVSQWLYGNVSQQLSDLDGSPLDRAILTVLIVLGLLVLSRRMPRVREVLTLNRAVAIFLLYCALSVLWSDFPFVTFKRWIRGAGDLVMVLIILTEKDHASAFKSAITRLGFLCIPASVLLIKYFPEYGRAYAYNGSPMWTGVCTDKNGLGAICMIVAPALLLGLLQITAKRRENRPSTREWLAKAITMSLTVYLIWIINSQTALACFLIGTALVFLTWLSALFRKPTVLASIVAVMVCSCFAVLFLGLGKGMLTTMGRNSSLTGRTEIWAAVLPLVDNPIIGAGYESFWMGERSENFARALGVPLNQSHNGYLEIYLSLGWLGICLLGVVIVIGYRNVIRNVRKIPTNGGLQVAFVTMCLVYNFTEATFKMMAPVWITFLWAAMRTPRTRPSQGDLERTVVPEKERYFMQVESEVPAGGYWGRAECGLAGATEPGWDGRL